MHGYISEFAICLANNTTTYLNKLNSNSAIQHATDIPNINVANSSLNSQTNHTQNQNYEFSENTSHTNRV